MTDHTQAGRYWLLVHEGEMHAIDWDDGERLLAVSVQVRLGNLGPQTFAFVPRGQPAHAREVTVSVVADRPLDLITAYQ